MTEGIVDFLEVVDIDEEDGESCVVAFGQRNLIFEGLVEIGPVEETGQTVIYRFMDDSFEDVGVDESGGGKIFGAGAQKIAHCRYQIDLPLKEQAQVLAALQNSLPVFDRDLARNVEAGQGLEDDLADHRTLLLLELVQFLDEDIVVGG